MKNLKKELVGYTNGLLNPTLQQFAAEIIELNRDLDIPETMLGTTEWIGHFYENAKVDVDPNISFEECQKAIWNELTKNNQ